MGIILIQTTTVGHWAFLLSSFFQVLVNCPFSASFMWPKIGKAYKTASLWIFYSMEWTWQELWAALYVVQSMLRIYLGRSTSSGFWEGGRVCHGKNWQCFLQTHILLPCPPLGGTLWECCGAFRRWSLAGRRETLGAAFEKLLILLLTLFWLPGDEGCFHLIPPPPWMSPCFLCTGGLKSPDTTSPITPLSLRAVSIVCFGHSDV